MTNTKYETVRTGVPYEGNAALPYFLHVPVEIARRGSVREIARRGGWS